MESWSRTTLSIDREVLHVLNKVPRTEVPSKSKLVEQLIRTWLEKHGYSISGSDGVR